MKGNVVGINTAIFSQSGGSVGIGFAVSSNLAKQVTDQLKQYGRTKGMAWCSNTRNISRNS